jgi:hypothetical protein
LLILSAALAAAYTAGLAAYFLRLALDQKLRYSDGRLVGTSPQAIKNFIVDTSWPRSNEAGRSCPAIFNGASIPDEQAPAQSTPGASSTGQGSSTTIGTTTKTTTSSTPTETSDPFGPAPPECHDESNFPGHADIHEDAVTTFAESATSLWTGYPYGSDDRTLGPDSEKLTHTYVKPMNARVIECLRASLTL